MINKKYYINYRATLYNYIITLEKKAYLSLCNYCSKKEDVLLNRSTGYSLLLISLVYFPLGLMFMIIFSGVPGLSDNVNEHALTLMFILLTVPIVKFHLIGLNSFTQSLPKKILLIIFPEIIKFYAKTGGRGASKEYSFPTNIILVLLPNFYQMLIIRFDNLQYLPTIMLFIVVFVIMKIIITYLFIMVFKAFRISLLKGFLNEE